jgi:hypothetical protein
MGDNWLHRITVERIDQALPDRLYPELLAGARRCPPEDCGGVPGHYAFLDDITASARSRGRRKQEALDWYGGLTIPTTSTKSKSASRSNALPIATAAANRQVPRTRK